MLVKQENVKFALIKYYINLTTLIMKWQGRQGSGNIEDRRGMSGAEWLSAAESEQLSVAIIVLLLGGDPSQLLNGTYRVVRKPNRCSQPAEEDQMAQFVSVVLKDTETVWGKIFEQSKSTYQQPTLVLFRGEVESACGIGKHCQRPVLLSVRSKSIY